MENFILQMQHQVMNKYLRINTDTPSETNVRFSVDIINYPADKNKFTIHYDANDNGEEQLYQKTNKRQRC